MGMGFGAIYEPQDGVNESANPTIHEVDAGRPRSATVVIRRLDGGIVGT